MIQSVKDNSSTTKHTNKIFKREKLQNNKNDVQKEPVEDEWEKSKSALERKALLYDGIKSGSIRSREDVLFETSQKNYRPSKSVDFVDKLLETDVVDEFGRTRKVSVLDAINKPISTLDSKPFTDVRTKGVGFYGFSTDMVIKGRQLDELRRKRLETLNLRDTHSSLAEQRRAYRERRLEIALKRKKRLSGL